LPTDIPAKDVVEKAKAQGMSMTIHYVYTIRTAAKRRVEGPGAGRCRGKPQKSAAVSVSHASSSEKTATPFLLFRHKDRAKPGRMKYVLGVTLLGSFPRSDSE
jgi:hypothetical protein